MNHHVNYLRYNVMLLQIGRQYKIENSSKFAWRFLHRSLRVFYNSYLTFLLVSLSVDIKNKGATELQTTALNYGFIGVTLCVVQRSTYYYLYEDKSQRLVSKLNALFKYETRTGLSEKSMSKCLRISNIITLVWWALASFLVLIFTLVPLAFGKPGSRSLPIPMWFPYEWRESPLYEITWFIQVFLLLIMVVVMVASDMFFGSIVMLTVEQFKLLGWELKNILYTSLIQAGIPKEMVCEFKRYLTDAQKSDYLWKEEEVYFGKVLAVLKSEKFAGNILSNLNRLVSFHQSLLSFCADMENFFSPLLLIFFLVIMFTALFLNVIVITNQDTTVIFSCVALCFGAYYEIIFPCVFGNMFTTQCEKLQMDLYELPWYECDQNFKKCFKFLLHRVSTPPSITLGKFADLNLTLVLWAIRTINSYCMVIYQMTQKN